MNLDFDARKRAFVDGFCVLKKNDRIFHINDGSGAFVTLVMGSEGALLVDTSWGIKNLRSLVEKLTDTPFKVVNTHGHPDHCYGNFQFDEVFVPERDIEVYKTIQDYSSSRDELFESEEERFSALPGPFPPLKTVKAGDIFDLGDLHVRAIPLYGHTRGSLGYLIEEEKVLLCGDAISLSQWLFLKEGLSLEEVKKTYEETLKEDFEKILGSHSKVWWTKELLKSLIQNINNVLEGKVSLKDASLERIMDYDTASFFCDRDPGCWILVPENCVKKS